MLPYSSLWQVTYRRPNTSTGRKAVGIKRAIVPVAVSWSAVIREFLPAGAKNSQIPDPQSKTRNRPGSESSSQRGDEPRLVELVRVAVNDPFGRDHAAVGVAD